MAITFVTSGSATGTGSSPAVASLTLSAGTSKLVCWILNQNNTAPNAPTWNGTAMTLAIANIHIPGMTSYYLDSPAIGTFDLSASRNDTANSIYLRAVAYSGTASGLNASISNSDFPFLVNVSTLSTNLTSTVDNCVFLLGGYQDNLQAVTCSNSGATTRISGASGFIVADSAPLSPAGIQNLTYSGGSAHFYCTMLAMAPSSTPANTGSFFMLM